MKRIVAILCASLLLMALAFGCNSEPAAVQLPDPTDSYEWTAPTLPETETEPVEPTDANPLETKTETTTKKTTTTTAATLSGSASSTKTTTTAKTTTTQKDTTKYYANGITIDSKDAALSAFNAAAKKAVDSKAGFNKSHLITAQDWVFDQEFLDVIPSFGGLIDPNASLSSLLNGALGKGMRTATAKKGESNSLIRASSLSMGDVKDVTYTGSASSGYTVTVTVKDGETRQEKRLFGNNRSTGSSPIDSGPLNQATSGGGLYDHMDADKIFALVKSAFTAVNVEPHDISESTSQVKFVAKLDGQGRLIELKATYNQTINLRDIRILNGLQSYKDNKGSSTVTVTYDAFVY